MEPCRHQQETIVWFGYGAQNDRYEKRGENRLLIFDYGYRSTSVNEASNNTAGSGSLLFHILLPNQQLNPPLSLSSASAQTRSISPGARIPLRRDASRHSMAASVSLISARITSAADCSVELSGMSVRPRFTISLAC